MARPDVVTLLVAAVVVGDLVLLALLLRHLPRASAARRARYDQWRRRLESDPRLRRLYDAHRRNWWRVGIVNFVDVAVSFAASGILWWLLAGAGVLPSVDITDGVADFEALGFLALCLGVWLGLWYVGIKKLGTTPGLRLAGLVAVSPEDGRPVPPDKLRPPYKGDYRRDDAPGLLFVPARDL
ncbi:MAG: hypothetical protein QN157_00480 [Armatimonadota bacterium]|nr:hypothetical protein [Armatimonadota bacterium]